LSSLQSLDNGLRLTVHERSDAHVVSIYLWFDVGSVDETEGLFGAAHVVEHMLFKGSSKFGVGEAASFIEGLGGDLNAYTTFDQTVLHATVMASKWQQALETVLDMATRPTFDPTEFAREKQVILEEVRGALGEPDYEVDLQVQGALFPSHGYGRPILGTETSVEQLGVEQVQQFWRRHYTPNRAVLSIAGAVTESAVHQATTSFTAGWRADESRPQHPLLPAEALPCTQEVEGEFSTRTVQLGWEGPSASNPDLAALDILVAALAQGRASIMNELLDVDLGIAHEIWGYLLPRTRAGVVTIGFCPQEGSEFDCLEAIWGVIERVAAQGLSTEEIERTKEAVLGDFLFARETMDSVAHDDAWYTARMGSATAREAYRQRLANTTGIDIQRVARTYLSPRKCAVAYQCPGLDKESVHRFLQRALPAPPPPAPRAPTTTQRQRRTQRYTASAAQRVLLQNGLTVLMLPDPSPVAAIRLVSLGGGLAERAATAGTRAAWSRTLLAGAGEHDTKSFSRAVERLAGDLTGIAGRNTLGLAGNFPSETFLVGLERCADLIMNPHFDRQQWAHVHEEMREHLLTLNDRPSEVAGRALNKRLWEGHPWALPGAGSLTSIRRITTTHLKRVHRAHFHPNNVVIALSGGFDPAAALPVLEERFQLPDGPSFPPPRPTPGPCVPRTERLTGGHEQSTVLLGFRAHGLHHPDRFALELGSAILGTQGGRLFMELRERHSLAYSVWAQSSHGMDGGQFFAGLATESNRADEAILRLQEQLHALAERPPDASELERSKNVLKGQAAMGLQRAADRATEAAISERLGIAGSFASYCASLDLVRAEEVSAALCSVVEPGGVTVRVDPRQP
jgi:zinc protease